MLLREHLMICEAIVEYLGHGERPSWEIEEALAEQFKLTKAERALMHEASRCPVWRNDVAWGLSELVQTKTIEAVARRRAPNGGTRGIYRLWKTPA